MADVATLSVLPEERLTWDEIKVRYPDQWVLLIGFEEDEDEEVTNWKSAIVVAHGPRRADAYANAREMMDRHGEIGVSYTGRIRAPIRVFLEP